MEFHAEMALPRVNSVRASEDEIGMDAIINQFIDRDFKFVFERVFGKCIDIGNGGEAGIDFNEGRICAEAHLNIGGRLVSEVFDGQVEAESLAVVGKAVGIVDAEIFVSEERPVGGNDLNVLIMSLLLIPITANLAVPATSGQVKVSVASPSMTGVLHSTSPLKERVAKA